MYIQAATSAHRLSTAPRGSTTFYRPKTEKRPRCLSQIDHTCVSERYKSNVQSSKAYWYPSIRKYTEPYDHGLVAIEFRFKITVRTSEMQANLDYSSLKCEKTRQELSDLIGTKLAKLGKSPKGHEETHHFLTKAPDLTDLRIFPAPNPLSVPKEQSESLTKVEDNPKQPGPEAEPRISPSLNADVEAFTPAMGAEINAEFNTLIKAVHEA